jgi:hypothetical protein
MEIRRLGDVERKLGGGGGELAWNLGSSLVFLMNGVMPVDAEDEATSGPGSEKRTFFLALVGVAAFVGISID